MNTNADTDNMRPVVIDTETLPPNSNSELMTKTPPSPLERTELEMLCDRILQIAHTCDQDCLQLLAVLRAIEAVHREIREDLFQPALPDNRQALYALLREIENEGGWPYINRMKIRDFLHRLDVSDEPSNSTET